jgi:hypothetical protein
MTQLFEYAKKRILILVATETNQAIMNPIQIYFSF